MRNYVKFNGSGEIQSFPKKASTAFEIGDLVKLDTNGYVVPTATGDTSGTVLGISQRTITSADSDYAQNTNVEVMLPGTGDLFTADVGGSTDATQALMGSDYGIDADGKVDLGDTTSTVWTAVKLIDTDTILVKRENK